MNDETREDRRHGHRRATDAEAHRILDSGEWPIARRLVKTGRVATAVAAVASLFGMAIGATGYRVVGPPADLVAIRRDMARMDSTIQRRADSAMARAETSRQEIQNFARSLDSMRYDIATIAYIQCVQLRRTEPDLRPKGCEGSGERQRR